MALKADTSNAPLQILVDGVTSPVTADVQVVELATVAAGAATVVGSANPLPVALAASTTGTPASVGASVTNVALAAANANRKGLCIFNDSPDATLRIALGFTSSLTAFTVAIGPGGYYELDPTRIFTGAVNGIWDTASGSARVTELT